MKLKINTEGLKGFFVRNGEKFAMLAGVICVVLAIFFALKQESLKEDKQATQLHKNTEDARRKVTEAGHAKLPVHDYMDDLSAGKEPVQLANYELPTLWDSPIKEEKIKRGEPPFLAVEHFRGATGHGAIAIRKKSPADKKPAGTSQIVAPPAPKPTRHKLDPNDPTSPFVEEAAPPPIYSTPAVSRGVAMSGDCVPIGYRWVCLTGMIPVSKQDETYTEKFKHAMRPQGFDQAKDHPKYIWYKIDREEIGSDGSVISTQWTEKQTLAAWRATAGCWGQPPNEPVPSDYVLNAPTQSVGPLTGNLAPLLLKDWDINVVSHPDILQANKPAAASDADKQQAAPADGLGGMDEPAPEAPTKSTGPKVITHKLFRCFDFTVEPEKKYRYRVSLMLDNPNYVLPNDSKLTQKVRYMENPEMAVGPYRFTEFSDWTDWISIPADHRLLIAGLKGSTNKASEPVVRVRAVAWDHVDGIETSKEFDMVRGDISEWNGVKEKVEYLDPAEHVIKPLATFDFIPRMLLLDVRGGGINGKNGPLEALLSDMRGNISIRSDEHDKAEVQAYTEMLTPQNAGGAP